MAVPAEIRAVPRPRNTVVENTGRPGPKQYPVRERAGCGRSADGRAQPHNGRTIGYIRDGVFVPKEDEHAQSGPATLSFGGAAFVKSVVRDMTDDLLAVFDSRDAYAVLAIATLRILAPGISVRRYAEAYGRTCVSAHYPGIDLPQNAVVSLLERLGKDKGKRADFFSRRIRSASATHHVVLDHALVRDSPDLHDLSAFSFCGGPGLREDVAVAYAYDVVSREAVCAQTLARPPADLSAYSDFLGDGNDAPGPVLTDGRLEPDAIANAREGQRTAHYLIPLGTGSAPAEQYGMNRFDGILKDAGRKIFRRKQPLTDGRFLYSFKDPTRAGTEEGEFPDKAMANDGFDADTYNRRMKWSGIVVAVSDLDLDPATAWRCLSDRWPLELVFRQFRRVEYVDTGLVNSPSALLGSDFINSVAIAATCRMVRAAEDAGLLRTMTFGGLVRELSRLRRAAAAPPEARSDDAFWDHPSEEGLRAMEALGLSIPPAKPAPRKRGRPGTRGEFVGPKRPRGRPRKVRSEQQP